jgi:hypothetical protein
LFSLDDIIDFARRNLFLFIGLIVFLYRIYGQYVETSKKAELENQKKRELAQRQERADGYEGYLDRTTATRLDDGRDDFSQTGQHNGPQAAPRQDSRGFEDLARDLQQARSQTMQPSNPQAELRRLLEEKMGRAPRTAGSPGQTSMGQSSMGQSSTGQSSTGQTVSPTIGRPSPKTQPTARRPAPFSTFEPDRTAASTFKPSSVTAPSSLEQNRVIEASFERSLVQKGNDPFALPEPAPTRPVSGSTFSSRDAVRAVIWNEILGPPKSKRR